MPLPYLVFGMVFAIVCLLGLSLARHARAGEDSQVTVTRQGIRSLSREQIREKLQKLEARKAPEPKMGAMCYEMAAPPERAEYVCPRCGEKTLYTNSQAHVVAWELAACRREFDTMKASSELALALDESSFCSHCSPAARTHQLALVVTYADGSACTNAPVSQEDLRILGDFLKGKLSYKTFNDGSVPLKDVLPRLRTLLGMPPETDGGTP